MNEIKRTTLANGGVPLGWRKFATETGIREPDWKGKLWARWGDAVREAGFEANKLTTAYEENDLLKQYAELAISLGHLPTAADIRLCIRNGAQIPEYGTFTNRFGGKPQLVAKHRSYCEALDKYVDVARMCDSFIPQRRKVTEEPAFTDEQIGFVYLMRSGRYCKIGRSNATGRRHREIGIQLPERLALIHEIRTDDPIGIEAYWHKRFEDKRQNGEWFALRASDIAAFKRRKSM